MGMGITLSSLKLDGIANAVQTILGTASYFAPLTSSLALRVGTGAATFTRATAGSVETYDSAGYLMRQALSGEARFVGARRVYNYIKTTSEDFTNAVWTKNASGTGSVAVVTANAVANPIDGAITAAQIRLNRGAGNTLGDTSSLGQVITTGVVGRTYLGSAYVLGTAGQQVGFRHVAGSGYTTVTFTGVWQRVSSSEVYSTPNFEFTSRGTINTTNDVTFYLYAPQAEDITGRTDQTTPSEYVSVGSPTSWLGTDLVTNGTFETDTNGWTAGGTATLSVDTNRLKITTAGVNNGYAWQAIATTVGAKYIVSTTATVGAGCTSANFNVSATGAPNADLGSVNTISTVANTILLEFTATSTTTYITFVKSVQAGGIVYFDNISVKPAIYHGSGVDGVKCFDTDLSGNPISTSGSYPLVGYVPWEARTNILPHSNTFSSWAAAGTPGVTQNAVGPNGAANYAWTLTDNDAGSSEGIAKTGLTLTAATWTGQVKVKKTTGAQTAYPVLFIQDATAGRAAICTIDTSNGVATVWTAYTGYTIQSSVARCSSHSAEFWLVELPFTATATADWRYYLYPAGTTNATQSTGILDVAAQGSHVFCDADLTLGSFATPAIPTTTVAVARNKDEFSETTSGAILAAGGTISLTYIPYHSPVGTIALWGTYVDASNYTAILHDATNLIFRKRIAGVNYDATIANAFTSGTTYKMAASWGAGGSTIYLNGVAGTPHANTTAAQIAATMQFGADGNSLQQPGAAVIKNYIWQRQLSGSEQAAVTA